MGYQVGRVCYEDYQTALDVYASSITPRILENGAVIAPQKHNDQWLINGVVFKPELATCDSALPFQQGLLVSSAIIGCIVVIFSIRSVKNALKAASYD